MSQAVDAKNASISRAEEALRSGRRALQAQQLKAQQLRQAKADINVSKVGVGGRECAWLGRSNSIA